MWLFDKLFMNGCMKNYHRIVGFLLRNGFNPDLRDLDGNTCLNIASENNHDKIVRLLLKHGANPNLKNRSGDQNSALMFSTINGNANIACFLIDNGADIYMRNKSGDSALDLSSPDKNIEIYRLLHMFVTFPPE